MKLKIREIRKEAHISQEKLASILQIAPRTLGAWERGENMLNAEQVCNLSVALGCTPNDILGWWDEHERPDDSTALTTDETALVESYRAMTLEFRETTVKTAMAVAGYSGEQAEPAPLRAERSA